MEQFSISWPTILVAVVVKQALGALWFSPMLFGKQWSPAQRRFRAPGPLTPVL